MTLLTNTSLRLSGRYPVKRGARARAMAHISTPLGVYGVSNFGMLVYTHLFNCGCSLNRSTGISFVCDLLQYLPQRRTTLEDTLTHLWFAQPVQPHVPPSLLPVVAGGPGRELRRRRRDVIEENKKKAGEIKKRNNNQQPVRPKRRAGYFRSPSSDSTDEDE